ncbi:M23 family metallopeptidase [Prescottella agglutinans]|uniref:M23 family metallopeptidase n=1 Tax=Prescottella agglutinans TaxID=1644129 RepID=A0A438BI53_9NOCA|nr:M23 family metallopeptidase [Prescottella agglutinans]RVW10766.1 M23 family metallopeptidase [Prescottella agglutinans]
MGHHRRTDSDAVLIEIDPTAPRGRHRDVTSGPGAGLKAATVAAATGAILTAGAQLGAGSAAADTAPSTQQFQIPEGLLPAGVELPALPVLPPAPTAQQIIESVKSFEIPAGMPQVEQVVDDFTAAAEASFGSSGSMSGSLSAPRAVKPVSGTLTSDFGPRWGSHHGGLDIAAPIGTPIYAAADGVVVDAGPASGYGLWVRVKHDDGSTTIYGHINDYQVAVGQQVVAGQQIATVGNRGQSTGPHLHFEVWNANGVKVDPSSWLEERGVEVTWRGASATM